MNNIIDYSHCNMKKVSVHRVGNIAQEETLGLSKTTLDISDIELNKLLIRLFLQPFDGVEWFHFNLSDDNQNSNPVHGFVSEIFRDPGIFHTQSIQLARHLFEVSVHPNIKSGDLFITYFSQVVLEGETAEAIGIFKSENMQSFLKLKEEANEFFLTCDEGIHVDKLDKGCLIFNLEQESGYKICIAEKSKKPLETHYWRELFLRVRPCHDGFHHTQDFLSMTSQYIIKQMDKDFEVNKADQIDLLNRSMVFFNGHPVMSRAQFETEVFGQRDLIDSFRHFETVFVEKNGLESEDHFEISPEAVARHKRVFKSVLKLDKNFHIYIHGDRQFIEQGKEVDGRKYYKIYYNQET